MTQGVAWILCSNRWNSAITEYALSTARALRLSGWTVFFSGLADSPGEHRARAYDLPGDSFKDFGLGESLKLRRLKKSIGPDAVFLFGGPETVLARFIPNTLRIRFRGQDKDVTDRLPPLKTRLNMQHCSAVLVPSRILHDRFQNILWQPVMPVMLGIDTGKFHFHPASYGMERRPTLRILGRLDPIKGHQTFFSIFRQLLRLWPKNRQEPLLEIIGEGANISADQLRRMATDQRLREGENWRLQTGRVENLSEVMSATDLAVISSLGSEVICRVAEEFLLCGVPLFVSGVGSLEECLVDKSFGCSYRGLSEERAATLLTEKLWQACQETEAQRQARAQAARYVFSLEVMGRQLSARLDELRAEDPDD
ncbi:MAG TPA: glycosyltransferase [Oligoflexus sp.]|uniref:glycosyltransferase n=1 Tax=Oligoflexus sp. TaxID=1971216 RepID=UPI002D57A383|nr:glycosyltransferase [Oligoflexus sp.]HYX36601.1 glycosyltransferase [Oligoflexus sp.]